MRDRCKILVPISTVSLDHTYQHVLKSAHEVFRDSVFLRISWSDLNVFHRQQSVYFSEVLIREFRTSVRLQWFTAVLRTL